MTLKPKSIQKIKESQFKSKLKSQRNSLRKLKEKKEQKTKLKRWWRNQGAVITGNGESLHHKFCKFCCAMSLEESEYNYISEYKLKTLECDIFCPELNYFIELENNLTKSKESSKLKQFNHLINSPNCDFFIFDISKVSKNYLEAVNYFKDKLGL